ncbi:hypothetical protein [Coleofasciculus sp. FACHB-129]|nr:hypothetical protein [Coleofasciculus sp. FACHB-129]
MQLMFLAGKTIIQRSLSLHQKRDRLYKLLLVAIHVALFSDR